MFVLHQFISISESDSGHQRWCVIAPPHVFCVLLFTCTAGTVS